MLRPYNPVTPMEWMQSIREVVQEIALLALWRSGFFEHTAFYGGTALRIFYGLNRFSEDLDFSLLRTQDSPRLESVLQSTENELSAWGFSFDAEPKSSGSRTGIESAFLKGNTRINLLNVGVPEELSRHFPPNQKITIKMELDTTPPPFASTEVKTHLLPTPFQVRLYDLPSLFAGKLHALLFRSWQSRVKGRDFYDFVWYVSRNVLVNLRHLESRILQSENNHIDNFDLEALKVLLKEKIESADISSVAEDVRPFLRDPRELELWSKDFFIDLVSRIQADA